jgi:hypothetical protein
MTTENIDPGHGGPAIPEPDPSRDPYGLVSEFLEALEDPALISAEDRGGPLLTGDERQAALRLAIVLGRIRLFGVNTGDLDGDLPTDLALGAAEELKRYIADLRQDAQNLEARCGAAESDIEEADLAADLLDGAMDVWAANTALHEAWLNLWLRESDGDGEGRALAKAIEECRDVFRELDRSLRECRDTLTAACDTELISNWRATLEEDAREEAPWWVAGELEQRAAELQSELLADLARRFVKGPSRSTIRFADVVGPHRALRAAAGAAESSRPHVLRWRGPEGVLAEMHVSPKWPDDREVRLVFSDEGSGAPIKSLAGTAVRLAGVQGQIDGDGIARFNLGVLRSAEAGEMTLKVGDDAYDGSNRS